jgi:hypothetical protein
MVGFNYHLVRRPAFRQGTYAKEQNGKARSRIEVTVSIPSVDANPCTINTSGRRIGSGRE